ncbi:MAG: enoyl-CoA hydratase, partial [Mesorhizobium sp.]
MTDHILVERQSAVQIIRMNRPDKKNALTRAMYAKMSAALAEGDERRAEDGARCG